MQSHSSLVATAYSAFNRRDIDAALTLMQADVNWPNGMEGGRVHGHDEVRKYWTRQWGLIDPHVEPTRIRETDDGEIVVDVHQVVRSLEGGILTDQMVRHTYRIEDDLITRMDIDSDVSPAYAPLRETTLS